MPTSRNRGTATSTARRGAHFQPSRRPRGIDVPRPFATRPYKPPSNASNVVPPLGLTASVRPFDIHYIRSRRSMASPPHACLPRTSSPKSPRSTNAEPMGGRLMTVAPREIGQSRIFGGRASLDPGRRQAVDTTAESDPTSSPSGPSDRLICALYRFWSRCHTVIQ